MQFSRRETTKNPNRGRRYLSSFEVGEDWRSRFILIHPNTGQFHQLIYVQPLRSQIPNAQKTSQHKQLFALLGSASIKAAHEHVDEIDPTSLLFLALNSFLLSWWTVTLSIISSCFTIPFTHKFYTLHCVLEVFRLESVDIFEPT